VVPLLDGLRAWAASLPDATLYVWLSNGVETQRLTFGELQQRSGAVAHQLDAWGIRPGDRVLLVFPPSSGLDFIISLFGCLRAGAIAVPAYPPVVTSSAACEQLRALRRLAATCGARIALTDTTFAVAAAALSLRCAMGTLLSGGEQGTSPLTWRVTSRLSSRAMGQPAFVEPPHAPHDVAFIQFSSGSTGAPKGVAVTHGSLAHNCALIRRAMGIDATCCEVSWLPLYHDMGLVGGVLAAVTVPVPDHHGALRQSPCVLMSPLDFLRDPLVWVRAMSQYRATHTQGPDFAYALITSRAASAVACGDPQITSWDLSSLRCALNGAEVARADTMECFRSMFGAHARCPSHALVAGYGLAESTVFVSLGATPVVLTCDRAALERASEPSAVLCGDGPCIRIVSCGKPPPEVDLLVVDPTCGAVVDHDGAVGEVWLRSGSVAAGYWGDPESTRTAFHAQPDTLFDPSGSGYLRTGDLGFLWQGELFITGRLKDVMVLRGKNVAPQDVEHTAMHASPALRPGGCAAFTVDVNGEAAAVLVAELRAPGQAHALPDLAARILQAVAATHGVALSDVVFLRPRTLPKTTSGKVRRFECRQRYAEQQLDTLWQLRAQRDGEALRTAVEHLDVVAGMSHAARTRCLAAAICKHLGIESPLTDMFASGMDSAGAAALHTTLERVLRVALPPATVFECGTATSLAASIVHLRWPQHSSLPDAADGAAWFDGAPEQPAYTAAEPSHHKQQSRPQRMAGHMLALLCAAIVVSHVISMRTALPVSWWSPDAARYVAHGPAFAPGWLPGHIMDLAHWRMLEWTRTVMPVHLVLNAAMACVTARLCRQQLAGGGKSWRGAASPRRITAAWGCIHAALLHGIWALPPLVLAVVAFVGTRAMLRVAEATTSMRSREARLHTLRCAAWVFILAAMLYFNLSEPGNALWPAVEQAAGALEGAFVGVVAFGRTPWQGVLGSTSFTANRTFRYMAIRLLSYVLDMSSSPSAKRGRLLEDFELFIAYATYAPLYLSGPVMTFSQFKVSAAALAGPSGYDPLAHAPDVRSASRILASAAATAVGLEIALQTVYWPSAILHPSFGGAAALPLRLTWCDHTLYAFLHLTATWASSACVFALPRGVALLQGVRAPNDCPVFWPGCCTSARSFWTHFHVSLSRWFTTYVYIPLGAGNAAVAVVMALSLHMHGFHAHWIALFTLAAAVLCLERSFAARAAWYRSPGALVRAANQTAVVMPMVLLACGGETLTATAFLAMTAACFVLSALQAARHV
jgi:acyl-CoA synthetase (AMP-forming)/AMP-acid ligase II